MRRLLVLLVLVAACDRTPDLRLVVRFPDDRTLLGAVDRVNMTASRSGVVLASSSGDPTGTVDLSGVSYGDNTVIELDGVNASSQLVARGKTCPLTFSAEKSEAPLYYAPLNFFAPTANDLAIAREGASVAALTSGQVLVAGGAGATGVLASTELFTPGLSSFSTSAATLVTARRRAQTIALSGGGLLLMGGLGDGDTALASGELYVEAQGQFLGVTDSRLDPRVDHRMVLLDDGRVLVTGGRTSLDGAALATSLVVYATAAGAYQITVGPTMAEARHGHALALVNRTPVVLGGYGADGAPIGSIEALELGRAAVEAPIGALAVARAEATASVVAGGVLVVGGRGADGAPLGTAELFDPLLRKTTVYPMITARYGHTATVLSGGRVLVAGGFDASGNAITSVELFDPDFGAFLAERPLGSGRGEHGAVALCDGTVLMISGGAGAEMYSPPL